MRRDAPRIGVELLLLGLILAAIGGALALVIQAHRRASVKVVPAAVAIMPPAPGPEPEPPTPPPMPPPPTPVDLTPGRLRPIAARTAEEKARAVQAGRRADDLDEARRKADAETRRLLDLNDRGREEVASRGSEVVTAERDRDALARERDILAEKRDDLRDSLERQSLRSRDGVAVLPYKGANGTWRRPIAIECRGESATLRPNGPSFSMSDMTSFPNPRRSPLVYAVAKAMVRARSTRTPDGAASVPYIMFIVRPDGVRPYYAARTLLEPLGLVYGYELADANWDIEFPDLDDPSEWTEIPGKKAQTWPPPVADAPSPGPGSSVGPGRGGSGEGFPSDYAATGSPALGAAGSPLGQIRPSSGMGPTGAPGTSRPSIGGFGQGGNAAPGGLGGAAAPGGPGLGGRALASPGDGGGPGGRSTGGSPWGGIGSGGGDSLDVAELERLSRGESALPAVPRDGRVPWRPGMAATSPSPAFQPAPPSGISSPPGVANRDGQLAGPASGGSGPAARPGGPSGAMSGGQPGSTTVLANSPRSNPAVAAGSSPGGLGASGPGGNPPEGVAGSRPLSEAIARGNGLVAPTAPNSTGRSAGTAASGSQVASGTSPATPTGGRPAGSQGSSASNPSQGSAGGTPGGAGGPGGSGPAGQGHGIGSPDGLASRSLPIVVACDRSGVTIHPGGEAIPLDILSRDDAAFPAKLRALVKASQDAEPQMGLRPRVNFLVKPGGEVAYLKARWQATTRTSYPTTWKMVDRGAPRLTGLETR